MSFVHESGLSMTQHRLSDEQRRSFMNAAQKQSKSEKIEEWKSLPLGDERQRQAWSWRKQEGLTSSSQSLSRGQCDIDIAAGPTSLPGHHEATHSTEETSSPSRALPGSHMSMGSPSERRQGWSTANTPVSAHHIEQATLDMRLSQDNETVVTSSTPAATIGAMSPPAARNTAPDRWRKYF